MTFFDTTKVYTNKDPHCAYAWWCSATRCAHAFQPSLYNDLVAFNNIMRHDCATLIIADRHSFCFFTFAQAGKIVANIGGDMAAIQKAIAADIPEVDGHTSM